ncbi:hypothetical protein MNBD_GAMMA16-798 [hydrothermal vent metagenome]|uniref:TerD domain-containing protein n=1 Tax=hydrothermal vent metagenome TaxID=652676 RepID=A0A3B0Z785_9ZZZZ
MELIAGQNTALNTQEIIVTLDVGQVPNGLVLAACAFALAANGKVRTDNDFVSSEQPILAGEGIARENDGQIFKLKLDKLPTDIHKATIAVTIENGAAKGQSLAGVGYVTAQLANADGTALGNFRVDMSNRREVALIMVEFYRHNTHWKLRAVGHGFDNGSPALAQHHGMRM